MYASLVDITFIYCMLFAALYSLRLYVLHKLYALSLLFQLHIVVGFEFGCYWNFFLSILVILVKILYLFRKPRKNFLIRIKKLHFLFCFVYRKFTSVSDEHFWLWILRCRWIWFENVAIDVKTIYFYSILEKGFFFRNSEI